MRHNPAGSRGLQYASLATLAAIMVGCGGGNGTSSSANLAITSANRDSVGHAAAAALLALSPAGAVPLLGGNVGVAQRQTAQSAGTTESASPTAQSARWPGRLVSLLLPKPGSVDPQRLQPQAVVGPLIEPCLISGTVTVSFDDKDGSASTTRGDVLDLTFNACKDSPFETLSGRVTALYQQVQLTPTTAIDVRLSLTQFSDTATNHALSLDGPLLLAYTAVSATGVETATVTADGPVVATVATHVFNDTVTLYRGFSEQAVFDPLAEPPLGSTFSGRIASTVSGKLRSTAMGGIVELQTQAGNPLMQYGAEAYPRAGSALIEGRTGRLLITALSAEVVQLDLDAQSDGLYESSTPVTWDWLL